MRKATGQDDKNESVQVLGNGPIPDVRLDDPSAMTAGTVGSAVRDDPDAEAEAPKPKWYRVIKGGIVLDGGFRARLKEGKEINSLNYNIRRLQQQGIMLQEFDPADEPVSMFG